MFSILKVVWTVACFEWDALIEWGQVHCSESHSNIICLCKFGPSAFSCVSYVVSYFHFVYVVLLCFPLVTYQIFFPEWILKYRNLRVLFDCIVDLFSCGQDQLSHTVRGVLDFLRTSTFKKTEWVHATLQQQCPAHPTDENLQSNNNVQANEKFILYLDSIITWVH